MKHNFSSFTVMLFQTEMAINNPQIMVLGMLPKVRKGSQPFSFSIHNQSAISVETPNFSYKIALSHFMRIMRTRKGDWVCQEDWCQMLGVKWCIDANA